MPDSTMETPSGMIGDEAAINRALENAADTAFEGCVKLLKMSAYEYRRLGAKEGNRLMDIVADVLDGTCDSVRALKFDRSFMPPARAVQKAGV